MSEHVEIARQEQGAWRLSLRDCLANELLSRIETFIQQELPGLRNNQNPVLRLEGILVSGGNPTPDATEPTVSLGSFDLSAWTTSAPGGASVYETTDVVQATRHQSDP